MFTSERLNGESVFFFVSQSLTQLFAITLCSCTHSCTRSRRIQNRIHKYFSCLVLKFQNLVVFDGFCGFLLSAKHDKLGYGSPTELGGPLNEALLIGRNTGLESLLFAGSTTNSRCLYHSLSSVIAVYVNLPYTATNLYADLPYAN